MIPKQEAILYSCTPSSCTHTWVVSATIIIIIIIIIIYNQRHRWFIKYYLKGTKGHPCLFFKLCICERCRIEDAVYETHNLSKTILFLFCCSKKKVFHLKYVFYPVLWTDNYLFGSQERNFYKPLFICVSTKAWMAGFVWMGAYLRLCGQSCTKYKLRP